MADWKIATNDKDSFLEFFRWVQHNRTKDEKLAITQFMMLQVLDGNATPVPAPLQTKTDDHRAAELVVSIERSAYAGELPARCRQAFQAADAAAGPSGIPKNRNASTFTDAADAMTAGGFDLGAIKADLLQVRDRFHDNMVQDLHDAYEQAKQAEALRARGNQAAEAAELSKAQKTKLLTAVRKHQKGKVDKHKAGKMVVFTKAIDGHSLVLVSSSLSKDITPERMTEALPLLGPGSKQFEAKFKHKTKDTLQIEWVGKDGTVDFVVDALAELGAKHAKAEVVDKV